MAAFLFKGRLVNASINVQYDHEYDHGIVTLCFCGPMIMLTVSVDSCDLFAYIIHG